MNRYYQALHAMQSAVKFDIENSNPLKSSSELLRHLKHVRVGINSNAASQEALATLLIAKGVFSEEEYNEAVADAMERERDRRIAEVKKKYNLGDGVTFG